MHPARGHYNGVCISILVWEYLNVWIFKMCNFAYVMTEASARNWTVFDGVISLSILTATFCPVNLPEVIEPSITLPNSPLPIFSRYCRVGLYKHDFKRYHRLRWYLHTFNNVWYESYLYGRVFYDQPLVTKWLCLPLKPSLVFFSRSGVGNSIRQLGAKTICVISGKSKKSSFFLVTQTGKGLENDPRLTSRFRRNFPTRVKYNNKFL